MECFAQKPKLIKISMPDLEWKFIIDLLEIAKKSNAKKYGQEQGIDLLLIKQLKKQHGGYKR